MIEYKYIELEQPVGKFFLGKLDAETIYKIARSNIRSESNLFGIQRNLNSDRVRNISIYCQDPDAIFPTPIILSGSSDYVTFNDDDQIITIDENKIIKDNVYFNVVDGQHRLEGIHQSAKGEYFILPLILILDTTVEQDAYLFSVINGNQKAVSQSLVLDLFSLSKDRSVEKVCNYLVKELNSDESSPLYQKIKMLGIKSENSPDATISQGTIIRSLIPLISKNVQEDNLKIKLKQDLPYLDPNQYIFRDYFRKEGDSVIYRILLNYFGAMRDAFATNLSDEDSKYMQKSIGYMVQLMLIRPLYLKGFKEKTLSKEFFLKELNIIFSEYLKEYISIKSKNYSSSESGSKEMYIHLANSWIKNDQSNNQYLSDRDKKKLI